MEWNERRVREKPVVKGIRIGVIYGALVALALVISVLLLVSCFRTDSGYNALKAATRRYITCQQDAESFKEGSDYLTSEARSFVATGDIIHAKQFVTEVEVTRRRDIALDDIEASMQEEASYNLLSEAMGYSRSLAEVELYAMRLAAAGWGVDLSELPEQIGAIALKAPDAQLAPEEQRRAATQLVFGDEYAANKAQIVDNVNRCIDTLSADTLAGQQESEAQLHTRLRLQLALIIMMLVILIAAIALAFTLLIRPLTASVGHIINEKPIPVSGAYEMRFLATAYNEMVDYHARNTERLTYSTTHDSVTGIYNRTAYDAMYRTLDPSNVGMLVIDIDKFKEFNDRFGHDVGDRVLRRVAQVLMDSFRSGDFVARIGGDEFCVVMRRAKSNLRQLVQKKLEQANALLMAPKDDLPPISISAGVAFGDRPAPGADLFKDADTALYRVKRRKKEHPEIAGDCCAFYDGPEE